MTKLLTIFHQQYYNKIIMTTNFFFFFSTKDEKQDHHEDDFIFPKFWRSIRRLLPKTLNIPARHFTGQVKQMVLLNLHQTAVNEESDNNAFPR